ncbi:MAG: hypothetical protein II180_07720, partial [Proteobacteria bacterium]|nr:hypothetical protein [Pseudomonadota bacterium]
IYKFENFLNDAYNLDSLMQHDVIGIGTASYCYLCSENFTSSTLMHAILTALNQIKFVQQLLHRVISIQLLFFILWSKYISARIALAQ